MPIIKFKENYYQTKPFFNEFEYKKENKDNFEYYDFDELQDIIQKYNKEKRVKVTFTDHSVQVMAFEELKDQDMTQVELIHSMEPTLEDIFIQLTGEKLND